MIETYSDVIG